MSAASTYAEALFGAARDRGELEEVREELEDFAASVEENEELRLFFYSEHIPEIQKRRAMDGLTEGWHLSARNFLKVLLDNDRAEVLDDVVRYYSDLVEEHLGRVEVELVTAVELDDSTLERVRERLEKILSGREVILHDSVDPDILGGAIFRFDGNLVNSSVRGQMDRLRDAMLERSVSNNG